MIRTFPVLLFVCFIIISKDVYSQAKISVDSVDSIMEELQAENNWGRMISLGESSLRKGYDSFFLRARLGMAYFETGQYIKAIPLLEITLQTGIDNPTLLTNLYYCYFFTGREADKGFVFSKLSERSKKRLQPLNNIIANDIFSDIGFSFSNDNVTSNSESSGTVNSANGELYTEQTFNGNAFSVGVGINQLLFQSLSIDYYYSYLKLDKTKTIQTSDQLYTNTYSEYQNRFYNKYNIRVSDGLVFSPAGHFIGTDLSTIYGNADSLISVKGNSGSQTVSVFEQQDIYDSFVLSADITKYMTAYSAGINGSFSYLNNIHQWQLGASFKMFPLKKASFYSVSDIFIQNQNEVANMIFNQSIGGFYKKKFFYDLFFTVGNLNNFNEKNGALVYNNPDVIKFKTGFSMKYYITPLFNLNLGYSFQSRERNAYTYVNSTSANNQPVSQKSSSVSYSVNNIFAGLKFTF